MAITFPISLASFFDGLRVRSRVFSLGEAVEVSETGGGEVLTADYGPRLWGGSIEIVRADASILAQAMAMAEVLREAGGSFYIYDKAQPFPAADLAGEILGATVPTLSAIAANRKQISLAGLPAGYVVSAGDKLSFSYDGGRRALHKVIVGGMATALGALASIEVRPHVRPDATLAVAVSLAKPACKAVLLPGSYQDGSRDLSLSGTPSFSWVQTLR
ncbi:hypothetical protein [Falsihalocynthiibacter sp. CO-5D18]|uniref:hypothetical protein n=1 Tax=Falsihalocynthiibacter sp. CO-5D18 TaxID=3240872 RepID=UPI00350EBC0F